MDWSPHAPQYVRFGLGARAKTRAAERAVRAFLGFARRRAGLPNAEQHSLRAGGATCSYPAGTPVSVIAAHGRWSPTSPMVLSYVRSVDRWRDNALWGIGL
jgi:hypothetical protein